MEMRLEKWKLLLMEVESEDIMNFVDDRGDGDGGNGVGDDKEGDGDANGGGR